jgi:uncharacterized repeat protein (TIGR01451 family)
VWGRLRRVFDSAWIASSILALSILAPVRAAEAGVPITLYRSFAGNLDFVGTAGSLRVGDCGVAPSGAGVLSGIPSGATIEAAYLYWAKSGAAADATVTLATPAQSGLTISATRSFSETFDSGGQTFDFYSGFADVTSAVAAGGNGTYQLSNLTFSTGSPYSDVAVCLGGWSLVVVYAYPSQPLRVVNVFDGFQNFRGGQISLALSNFVVPSSPINGRLGHVTWEGDAANSAPLSGFQEQLVFEGLVLAGLPDNPSNNQFNSVSNITSPTSTPQGVDFDAYLLSPPQVFAGMSSATTVYSSGGDRVLLSAEVFSVTSVPVADLSITKVDDGPFTVGQIEDWRITVQNDGPSIEPGPIAVTDTLPSGTSFDAATGTGWTCSEASGTVSCSHPGPLAPGSSLPDLSISVLVGPSALPQVTNTASVTGTAFDNRSGNNSAGATTSVTGSNLSTSTKTVVDLNGGDVEPGDVLRYTISLIESAGFAATGVRVIDEIPADVVGFTVTSTPSGSIDASTAAPTGANGTGHLDIGNVSVPASSSVDLLFEVTVAPGTPPGSLISNLATITAANGLGASPIAPDLVVSLASAGAAGIKPLYLGNPAAPSPRALSRTAPNGLPPTATLGSVQINPSSSATWTLSAPLAGSLALSGANFPVLLRLGGLTGTSVPTSVRVEVASSSLGLIATTNQTASLPLSPAANTFVLNPGSTLPAVLPAGDVLTLTVRNLGTAFNQRMRVFPAVAGAGNSRIELNAVNVIDVVSLAAYDAAAPLGSIPTHFERGDPVFVRAVLSDPFGAFDITGATLEILDSSNAPILGPVAMSEFVASQTARTKTFEHSFSLSGSAAYGTWTARVTAIEGFEGTVTDLETRHFEVGGAPDPVLFKLVSVLDDPVNGTTNPKAIPGATVLYTIGVSNQGARAVDPDGVLLEDVLPATLDLFVAALGNRGLLDFIDGSPASGVDVVFTSLSDDGDDVEFDDGSGTWTLDPVPDGDGYAANVRAIRIRPSGTLQGSSGTPPGFEIRFKARIQ